MTQPDGLDQYGSIDPVWAAAHGIKVVADYLSHTPDKDWTAPQIRAYLAADVACMFLWETQANRALDGYGAGFVDGSDAAGHLTTLIAQVGFTPDSKLSITAAYDFDTNPSQYPVINAYAEGFQVGLAGRFLAGAYAEADLIDELGPRIDVAFQTYAWSKGRLSARADYYQYLINQTLNGSGVDFDRIIDAAGLGAWWPTGLAPSGGGTPIPAPSPAPKDDDMPKLEIVQLDDTPEARAKGFQSGQYLRMDGARTWQHLNPAESDFYTRPADKGGWYVLSIRVVSPDQFGILKNQRDNS